MSLNNELIKANHLQALSERELNKAELYLLNTLKKINKEKLKKYDNLLKYYEDEITKIIAEINENIKDIRVEYYGVLENKKKITVYIFNFIKIEVEEDKGIWYLGVDSKKDFYFSFSEGLYNNNITECINILNFLQNSFNILNKKLKDLLSKEKDVL